MTIPGIGPVGATALAALVTDPHQFRLGRQFAAWLGLTPLQKSSDGKERLGRFSKVGDKYLRIRQSIHGWPICSRESPCGSQLSPWQTRQHGPSPQS
jgi:transposase